MNIVSFEEETGYTPTQAMIDVLKERTRQDSKWGTQNHNPFAWLAILMEEVGEVSECMLDCRFGKRDGAVEAHMREEAVQVAAVAMAIVECLDRSEWTWTQE